MVAQPLVLRSTHVNIRLKSRSPNTVLLPLWTACSHAKAFRRHFFLLSTSLAASRASRLREAHWCGLCPNECRASFRIAVTVLERQKRRRLRCHNSKRSPYCSPDLIRFRRLSHGSRPCCANSGANRRRPLGLDRQTRRYLSAERMRQLLELMRI